VSFQDLLRQALRMQPERLVIGGLSGAEALDALQAVNTGHDGSIMSVHATSIGDALHRLEMFCLMASIPLSLVDIRAQIASVLQLIVLQQRLPMAGAVLSTSRRSSVWTRTRSSRRISSPTIHRRTA
jgi:pilus assembly protein CpaF